MWQFLHSSSWPTKVSIHQQDRRVMNLYFSNLQFTRQVLGDYKHLISTSIFNKRLFNTLSKVKMQTCLKSIQCFTHNIKKQQWFVFFFYWQTVLKRSRKYLPVRRRGSNWWTLPNKDTRMTAPLECRSPCLSSRSLPLSLWYGCRLSAWYLLLLERWSRIPHTPSLPLSPT